MGAESVPLAIARGLLAGIASHVEGLTASSTVLQQAQAWKTLCSACLDVVQPRAFLFEEQACHV